MPNTSLQQWAVRLSSCQLPFGKNDCYEEYISETRGVFFVMFECQMNRFPFEWRNPIGYLAVVASEYVVIVYIMKFVFSVLFFAMGNFMLAASATKCLKDELKLINENAASKRKRVLTLKLLTSFIRNHSTLKQLSAASFLLLRAAMCCRIFHGERRITSSFLSAPFRMVGDASDIYEPILSILSVWSIITICSVLLLIQILIVEYFEKFFSFSMNLWGFFWFIVNFFSMICWCYL